MRGPVLARHGRRIEDVELLEEFWKWRAGGGPMTGREDLRPATGTPPRRGSPGAAEAAPDVCHQKGGHGARQHCQNPIVSKRLSALLLPPSHFEPSNPTPSETRRESAQPRDRYRRRKPGLMVDDDQVDAAVDPQLLHRTIAERAPKPDAGEF